MTELKKSIKLSECSWIWQFWQIIVNFITAKLAWQNWKFEEILVKFVTGKSAKWMWRIWQIFAIFVTVCICGHISRNLEVNYKRNWETEARHEGNLTDWLLTGNRQKTNGILWPRLYVHKNTKGTDQLKGTLRDLRENIDFNRCPLENMHSTTLKQLYLAKFTKLRRVVSMSWITEQKQTEVNKKTTKYLWKHYTLKLMAECHY